MKTQQTLIYIVLGIASMLGLLAGCRSEKTPSYDERLSAADSVLRHNDPDSALRLLSDIDGGRLPSAADRAYHALLLTQAQYRCYVDITSDSTIDVALDYYQRHADEQEKLTRAYIYKGAVTEELGYPEVAMTCYKQAVSAAAPNDHFNQGYAKMRIGSLYRDNLVMDSVDITYLKQALLHFKQVPDSFYTAQCLSTIGGSYAAYNQTDSALLYLEQAVELAKIMRLKPLEQSTLIYLADLKMFSNDIQGIEEAKTIALSVLNNEFCPKDRRDHLLLVSAYTLAKLNKANLANKYLSQIDKNQLSDNLLVLYHDCQAEIARCHGDINQFQYHFKQADNLADSLLANDTQRQLRDIEAKYDNEILRYEKLKYKTNWQLLMMGSLLAISLLTIALLMITRKSVRRKRQITANESTIERLKNDTAQLSSQLAENHAMSEGLKATISHQINTFTQLVELHYTLFTRNPKKFDRLFRQAYDMSQPDQSFWAGIRSYADSTHNGIITRTLEKFPSVSENDARFMSLCCCHLPTTVIMVCMGYNDVHSVYNKKHRIEVKLGDNQRFDDYILSFENRQQDGISEA